MPENEIELINPETENQHDPEWEVICCEMCGEPHEGYSEICWSCLIGL